jgi:hypothetical protein
MITADTITDEQIRELRRVVVDDPGTSSMVTDDTCNLCSQALDDGRLPHRIIRAARARYAEILNERRALGRTGSVL